jgi:hypothetical protein
LLSDEDQKSPHQKSKHFTTFKKNSHLFTSKQEVAGKPMSPTRKTHKSMVNKIFQNKYMEESEYTTEERGVSDVFMDKHNEGYFDNKGVNVMQSESLNASVLNKINKKLEENNEIENYTSINDANLGEMSKKEIKNRQDEGPIYFDSKNEGVFLRKKKAVRDQIKNSGINESNLIQIQSGNNLKKNQKSNIHTKN